MTDARRALGRLAAKGARWPDASDTTPSTTPDRLETADILAALGMTHSRIGTGLALARYSLDGSMLLEVHTAGLAWAEVVAEERDWRLRRGGKVMLTGMVWLAIIELTQPQLCRTCKGRGAFYSRKNKLVEDCEVCGGGGHRPRSDRSRARFCKIDYRSWRRRWRDRYPLIYAPLSEAIGLVMRDLQLKLN